MRPEGRERIHWRCISFDTYNRDHPGVNLSHAQAPSLFLHRDLHGVQYLAVDLRIAIFVDEPRLKTECACFVVIITPVKSHPADFMVPPHRARNFSVPNLLEITRDIRQLGGL
jgi:hypothetical protein